jgi:hypothetical protein
MWFVRGSVGAHLKLLVKSILQLLTLFKFVICTVVIPYVIDIMQRTLWALNNNCLSMALNNNCIIELISALFECLSILTLV